MVQDLIGRIEDRFDFEDDCEREQEEGDSVGIYDRCEVDRTRYAMFKRQNAVRDLRIGQYKHEDNSQRAYSESVSLGPMDEGVSRGEVSDSSEESKLVSFSRVSDQLRFSEEDLEKPEIYVSDQTKTNNAFDTEIMFCDDNVPLIPHPEGQEKEICALKSDQSSQLFNQQNMTDNEAEPNKNLSKKEQNDLIYLGEQNSIEDRKIDCQKTGNSKFLQRSAINLEKRITGKY